MYLLMEVFKECVDSFAFISCNELKEGWGVYVS